MAKVKIADKANQLMGVHESEWRRMFLTFLVFGGIAIAASMAVKNYYTLACGSILFFMSLIELSTIQIIKVIRDTQAGRTDYFQHSEEEKK